jgi:hypothetical protein
MGPELRAVLAHTPTLSLEASSSLRLLQRQRRHFLLPLGIRIECREVVPYDLLSLIALKALRSRVPAGDMPVAIQHIDRVVGDRLNKKPITPLAGLRSFEAV